MKKCVWRVFVAVMVAAWGTAWAQEGTQMAQAGGGKRGLVLHYSFEKGGTWGAGSLVKDLSGGGHDGRVEGDGLEGVRGMGKRETAVRFDGKGDYIRVPRDEAFEGQEVSVAAWVKVRKDTRWEAGATIVFKRNSSLHHNEGACLEIFPDRTVRTTVSGPKAAQCRVQSTVPMEDDVWHHVAMVHAPGDTRLYVDGVLAGEGKFPREVVHNAGADLLIAGRDHAQYPMGVFGMFDLAEVKVWNKALEGGQIEKLYGKREKLPGVGGEMPGQSAVVEFGPGGQLTWKGNERPTRVFPAWEPGEKKAGGEIGLVEELHALVAQGRRDRAASPEFLDALEKVLEKQALEDEKSSDKLPLKPDFRRPGMPAGWKAVDPTVWRFGDGAARQVESMANTRYVLFYEPGMAWRDYSVTVRFESDRWLEPNGSSAASVWVRYRGVDDAYRIQWLGGGDMSVVSREEGGREREVASTWVTQEVVRDGKPWIVRVRGDKIVVEHDGQRYLEVSDLQHTSGTVGLESIHIPMTFRDVEVW